MRRGVRRSPLLPLPWRAAEFLVLDLETTGLDLRRDEIMSYGFVVVRDGRIQASSAVEGWVDPRRSPSPAAVAVHGMRRADVAGAPSDYEAVQVLARALSARTLVAHASWVEKAFLTRMFARYGCRLQTPIIDTAALARAASWVRPRADAEPDLEALCTGRGLPVHTPHQALGDALTTAGLFLALAGSLEAGADRPLVVADLVQWSAQHRLR